MVDENGALEQAPSNGLNGNAVDYILRSVNEVIDSLPALEFETLRDDRSANEVLRVVAMQINLMRALAEDLKVWDEYAKDRALSHLREALEGLEASFERLLAAPPPLD